MWRAKHPLKEQGMEFQSLTEHLDTSTPVGRLIFTVFASIGEFERDLNRERTTAGLAAVPARGRSGEGRRDSLQRIAPLRCVLWLEHDHNFDYNWAKHMDIMGVRVSAQTHYNPYPSVSKCLWILRSRVFRKPQVEGSNPPAGSSKISIYLG
jgi:hypothetical protein